MKKRLEESLIDALSFCSLRDLPDVENGTDIWIRALAKVAKADGSYAYVYVEKVADTLENRVKKDFGSVSSIMRYIEYYPFSYLDSLYMPVFEGETKEERVKYLSKVRRDKDFSGMTLKELNREVIKVAIMSQLTEEKRKQEIL